MATTTVNSQLTFRELSNRLAPGDKDIAEITEVMEEENEMLLDIPWFQCNQVLSEKFPRRTALPQGTQRRAYQGVPTTTSTTQVVVEPVSLLEALSEIDEDIVNNAGDLAERMAFRRTEDIAHVSGLSQQLADLFLEGVQAGSPESFDGLQIRLNDLGQTNVIDGGNSGGTSIYAVDWGRRTAYGIYPAAAAKRGTLGLQIIDKDVVPVLDGSDDTFHVYRTQFKWWMGLCIRDELRTCRYANINPTIGGTNSFNENLLIELVERCKMRPATTRIYCNVELRTQMRIRLKDKTNVNFGKEEGLGGVSILTFMDIPVRRLDAIKTNESTVTT